MQDSAGIAAIRHRGGEPPAYAKSPLSLPQQQQAGVGGLVAAVKIHCEFLAADGWQVEGKRRIGVHDGCGMAALHEAVRLDNDCLCESRLSRHCRHSKITARA